MRSTCSFTKPEHLQAVPDPRYAGSKSIAYVCAQEPVLFSATIAANVRYGKENASQQEVRVHSFPSGAPCKGCAPCSDRVCTFLSVCGFANPLAYPHFSRPNSSTSNSTHTSTLPLHRSIFCWCIRQRCLSVYVSRGWILSFGSPFTSSLGRRVRRLVS